MIWGGLPGEAQRLSTQVQELLALAAGWSLALRTAQIREEAAAYKNRVVQEAEGEAQRFLSVYNEYSKAPDVTRKRLFLETLEKVFQGSNKVIVEGGQEVVPYLPLPELEKRRPADAGGNP